MHTNMAMTLAMLECFFSFFSVGSVGSVDSAGFSGLVSPLGNITAFFSEGKCRTGAAQQLSMRPAVSAVTAT